MSRRGICDIVLRELKSFTLEDIKNTIDDYIQNKKINFCFVVNFDLAVEIMKILKKYNNIENELIELNSDINEYYISVDFYDNGTKMFTTSFCEKAKLNDEYLINDFTEEAHYFIFVDDINFTLANEKLKADKVIRLWCKLVEEKDEKECNCDNCTCNNGMTDEEEAIAEMIDDFVEIIKDNDCDIESVLLNIFDIGRQIGFKDCSDYIRDTLDKKENNIKVVMY